MSRVTDRNQANPSGQVPEGGADANPSADGVWNNLPGSMLFDYNQRLTAFRNHMPSNSPALLYQSTYDAALGQWSPWENLDGPVRSLAFPPAALPYKLEFLPANLVVMVLNEHNELIYRTRSGDRPWSQWKKTGSETFASHIAALRSIGGIMVLVRALGGDIWTNPSLVESPSGWVSLGHASDVSMLDPVAIPYKGGTEVFARDNRTAVWHIGRPGKSAPWGKWQPLCGVTTSNLAAANLNVPGQVEIPRIFARGSDGALWWMYKTPEGPWAKGWSSLHCQVTSAPAVYIDATGIDHVFARGPNGELGYTKKQLDAQWSAWASLGTPPGVGIQSAPVAVKDPSVDQAWVFVLGSDNALWWLIYRPGGLWKNWERIPPPSA